MKFILLNILLISLSFAKDCLNNKYDEQVSQNNKNVEDILTISTHEKINKTELVLSEKSCFKKHMKRNPAFKKDQGKVGALMAITTVASAPVGILGGALSFFIGPGYNMRHEKALFKVIAQAYLGEGEQLTELHSEVSKEVGRDININHMREKLIELDSSGYLCNYYAKDCEQEEMHKGRCGVTAFGHAEMDRLTQEYLVHLYTN